MKAWNGKCGEDVDLKAEIEKGRAASVKFRRAYDVLDTAAQVARLVAKARAEAGLTQRQLAKRMGTSQAQVHRLEMAEYGHSIDSLVLAAAALDRRVVIHFEPVASASGSRRAQPAKGQRAARRVTGTKRR